MDKFGLFILLRSCKIFVTPSVIQVTIHLLCIFNIKASLEVDKAKRQKQDEEQERFKLLAKQAEDEEKKKEEERKNKMQTSLNRLPNEPDETMDQKCLTRIRFRLPNGEMLQRRFLISNKLETLFDFLTSNGYFVEEFKVLSSWPRYVSFFPFYVN